MEIHKDNHNKCKFCSQNINQDLWERRLKEIEQILKKDIEFESFETDIKDTIVWLNNKIEFIYRFNIDIVTNQFLTQYQEQANK